MKFDFGDSPPLHPFPIVVRRQTFPAASSPSIYRHWKDPNDAPKSPVGPPGVFFLLFATSAISQFSRAAVVRNIVQPARAGHTSEFGHWASLPQILCTRRPSMPVGSNGMIGPKSIFARPQCAERRKLLILAVRPSFHRRYLATVLAKTLGPSRYSRSHPTPVLLAISSR